ncbi:MAG TPA: ABC transporter permease [Candidatus Krumholzibacteria bacterium]|nr:ABC transporter permease [Candidatus Krumholzibacteria bacterium]HRX49823.1 ABC transporter permease [Candidatus Krumholzibacteria bacterium]
MNLLEGVRIALGSLRTHKLRTFLTLLGNIVGTMSVIAVVSLINGVDIYARQKVLEEGSNVFTVSRVNMFAILTDLDAFLESLDNPDLTLDDVRWLSRKMETAGVVGAHVERTADLRGRGRDSRGVTVRGKTADYPLLEDLPLHAGRHITPQEVAASRPVTVLGWEVARDLFPELDDPVGRTVKLGGRHLEVVGVVEDRGTVLGNSRNRFAVIPVTTHLKVFGARESVDIKVAVDDLTEMESAQEEARALMRVRHRLRPMEDDDFGVVTRDELLQLWSGVSKAIYAALTPLVGISLVVGGIVLMNIMLVAVTERTREVGVRKAVGATRLAILWQFLVESVTLSLAGGVLGILIGLGLALAIAAASPLPFAFASWAPALGLGVTFVLGLVFGTYPAWKAAGLDPVEALRHE